VPITLHPSKSWTVANRTCKSSNQPPKKQPHPDASRGEGHGDAAVWHRPRLRNRNRREKGIDTARISYEVVLWLPIFSLPRVLRPSYGQPFPYPPPAEGRQLHSPYKSATIGPHFILARFSSCQFRSSNSPITS
jgi:hypothetical protein